MGQAHGANALPLILTTQDFESRWKIYNALKHQYSLFSNLTWIGGLSFHVTVMCLHFYSSTSRIFFVFQIRVTLNGKMTSTGPHPSRGKLIVPPCDPAQRPIHNNYNFFLLL